MLRIAVNRCDLMVDLPEPDSPLLRSYVSFHVYIRVFFFFLFSLFSCSLGRDLQKDDGLVLRSMAQTEPGTVSHLLGASHGAPLLAAIGALGGRRIIIDRD